MNQPISARTNQFDRLWRKARTRSLLTSASAYFAIAIICGLVLNSMYKFRHADLRIPLVYSWDATFYEVVIKNLITAGHYYVNPLLGAPGIQEMYDFPLPHAIHVLGFAIMGLFSHDFGLVINLYYLLSFPLEAMTAFFVFRRFGVAAGAAIAGGVLFAFLPFHLQRSQGHLILTSYFLVPLVVMMLLWICEGHPLFGFETEGPASGRTRITRAGMASLIICVLIASDNPYWAWFSGIFVLVAGVVARFRYGRRRALWTAGILGAVIAIVFCLNLAPNIIYSHRHGLNPVNHRLPVESEIYGLRITQMLLPVFGHRIHVFAKKTFRYDSQALMVNENQTATLGIFGSLGFLILLGCLFVRKRETDLDSLSLLNLTAVLLATLGGFGTLFSYLIWSQFRAYNRISVFIAFFSLFALLLVWERWLGARPRFLLVGSLLLPIVLMGVGLPDEIPTHFLERRSVVEATFRYDEDFFRRLEASVPSHSMIFQLPYVPFLGAPPPGTAMVEYDELKGYLHAKTLRWSGGAVINRETDAWIRAVSAKPVNELVADAAAAGFAGIYVDRYGYTDKAVSVESQFQSLLGTAPLSSADGRRSFFRFSPGLLNAVRDRVAKGEPVADLLPPPVMVQAGNGCSAVESSAQSNWRWCDTAGEIVVSNPNHEIRKVTVEATLASAYPSWSSLSIEGPGFTRRLNVNNTGTALKLHFIARPGNSVLRLRSDAPRAAVPGDPRSLVFRIINLRVTTEAAPVARE